MFSPVSRKELTVWSFSYVNRCASDIEEKRFSKWHISWECIIMRKIQSENIYYQGISDWWLIDNAFKTFPALHQDSSFLLFVGK